MLKVVVLLLKDGFQLVPFTADRRVPYATFHLRGTNSENNGVAQGIHFLKEEM